MDELHKSWPYVHRTITRHGKVAYYFHKRPGNKIRIRESLGSPAFKRAYYHLLYGDKIPPKSTARQTGRRKKEKVFPVQIAPRYERIAFALERAFIAARGRARKRKLQFDIDFEWVMTRAVKNEFCCEMTGIMFLDKDGDGHRTHPYAPTLDRIDSKGGYTKHNTRVVICAFNIGVLDWDVEVYGRVAGGFQKRLKALEA